MEGARIAGPEDFEPCALLIERARASVVRERGGPELVAEIAQGAGHPFVDEIGLARWATDATHLLLAGTFEGAVVGVAAARQFRRASDLIGVVDCLYVEPAARGVGVGTELATGLVEWCTQKGCRTLDAPALPGDRATKQLFESLGFSARRLLLRRQLQ